MIAKQTAMLLDMIVSSFMGFSFLVNTDFNTKLLGAALLTFSYAMHQTLHINHYKGNSIALNTKTFYWVLHSLISVFHGNYSQLTLTIPMFILTSYHMFFQDPCDCCSHDSKREKRIRAMRKRINALRRRAENHPTVHDGYKTD